MAKRILLFDIDGTLIRTGGVASQALDQALEELCGISGGMALISPAGNTDPRIVRQIFAKVRPGGPLGTEEIDRILDRYVEIMVETIPAAPTYRVLPGLPELLGALQNTGRTVLGLATGNIEKGGRLKLERGGLNPYFPFGGFASDHEERPQIVRVAVERGRKAAGEDVPAENIFVVGDTPHDIAAARAAGVKVIAVATGPHRAAALAGHRPDLLVESLSEARRILDFVGV